MRILIRVGIGLVLLLVVAAGALALWLPRLVESPAVRERIEAAAREATGREVTYRDLSVGLFPPRLVVAGPSVAGAATGDPPFAEAESVGLQLAVGPLLARTVVVDSLVVEGATVRLRRTAAGIELPVPPEAEEPDAPSEPAPQDETGAQEAESLALAVRDLTLRNVRVVLEDRAVSPPVTWDLTEVNGKARADSLDEPIDVQLSAVLASGGSLEGSGTVALDGPMDLTLELQGVETAQVGPYLGPEQKLGGRLSGSVGVRGTAEAPQAVKADLVLENGEVDLEDLRLRGRLSVSADLEGPDLAGPFEIDATQASLDYGEGVFVKPAGEPATAAGRVVPRSDGGYDVEDLQIGLHNMDASGRVSAGQRMVAELSAPSFRLEGWEALVPALREYGPGGRVEIPRLRVATAPLDVTGEVGLRQVSATPPESPSVTLDGVLQGRGRSLAFQDLLLTTADQTLQLTGAVENLDTAPRLDLGVRGQGLASAALAKAYAGSELLGGPLTLEADVRAPLTAESLAEALTGQIRWRMDEGWLRGTSLLKQTFGALGQAAEAALLVNRLRGSDKLERFYEERFQEASATFRVSDGVARTDDLRLVYRHYIADLRGSIGLLDQRLDLTGEIIVDEAVDAALAGDARARGDRTVIPLARVTGTVDSPRVDLSPRAVTALATRYAIGRERSELERKLDEELGEGAGRAAGELLEGILGGRNR